MHLMAGGPDSGCRVPRVPVPAHAKGRARGVFPAWARVLLFVLAALLAWTYQARAAERGFVLHAGTFNLPPWGWIEDGKPMGVIYDLHTDVARRTGLPFTNDMYPFTRLAAMLERGELDFISGQPHDALLKAGEKLALLHTIDIIAVARKGSGIERLEDLAGKVVVYHRVASYPQLDALPGNIIRVDGYEQSVKMLMFRRDVDAAVFSGPSFYYFMKKNGFSRDDFGRIITVERDREDWVFVRRDLPREVKDLLRLAVEEATREGMYDKLLVKYGVQGGQ
ncbi:MAG: substrate-binding periplasmic protein [Thermodesulfobacteriota bacterium]